MLQLFPMPGKPGYWRVFVDGSGIRGFLPYYWSQKDIRFMLRRMAFPWGRRVVCRYFLELFPVER